MSREEEEVTGIEKNRGQGVQGEPGHSVQQVVAGWDLLQQVTLILAGNKLEGTVESGRQPQMFN